MILDYQSPQGPQVTDIRGIVLQGGLTQIREQGHYDEYIARLPASHRDQILNSLASSWVSAEAYLVHLETLEALGLSDTQLARLSEPLGAGLFHNLFASMIRAARNNGGEGSIWLSLRQLDRIFSRMHQGGGCKVTKVGPKDVVVDSTGLSFGHLRCYRIGHCAFIRGAFSYSTKACVCKPQHDPQRDRLSVLISWV